MAIEIRARAIPRSAPAEECMDLAVRRQLAPLAWREVRVVVVARIRLAPWIPDPPAHPEHTPRTPPREPRPREMLRALAMQDWLRNRCFFGVTDVEGLVHLRVLAHADGSMEMADAEGPRGPLPSAIVSCLAREIAACWATPGEEREVTHDLVVWPMPPPFIFFEF